jgi:predicted RNase H-like HicB family nuclease
MMNYPIVIHKDADSDYGVTVPDLPGCFSAGSTLDEVLAMAREAIELHLEGLIEEGQPVPTPRPIEQSRKDPIYRGGTWAVVSIDPACLRVNAKRINITMPQRILDAVDRHAAAEYETRSGLLTKAAVRYLAEKRSPAAPSKTRARYRRRRPS